MTVYPCPLCKGKAVQHTFFRGDDPIQKCLQCQIIFRSYSSHQNEGEIQDYYQNVDPSTAIGNSRQDTFYYLLDLVKSTGGTLLDIGCGDGSFLLHAQKKGFKIAGVERVDSLAQLAAKRLGTPIKSGDALAQDFPAGSFRVITLINVLYFLKDPQAFFLMAHRWLDGNGCVVIRVQNPYFLILLHRLYETSVFSFFLKRILSRPPSVFHQYDFYPGFICEALKRSGFANIRVCNSPLSKKNPYDPQVGRFTQMAKSIIWVVVQSLYFLSWRRLVLSPSYLVTADKKAESFVHRAGRA